MWWNEVRMLASFAFSYTSRRIPCCGAGDGREEKLMNRVLENAERNPESVIQTMDAFAKSGTWFMSIGDRKGKILDAALQKRKPTLVLELGSYCGYSAVRIASQLAIPGSKLFTVEINPRYADIARQIIDHAGLSSQIHQLPGPLSTHIEALQLALKSSSFDFVFMDHSKDYYLEDYLLLKNFKLIGDGSVVFADNLGFPGSPQFWNYLHRGEGQELETEYHQTKVEYLDWINDTVAISTVRG
ncbi:catechol O-methyltransferase-like [Selaginella moellendorffii]|uniref:catechol O-methyltransferase-like n=1 Tax=Selaginella moellendorffii TaxID=88036 RepID=UPI000D1CC78D|nr:catechol O-methyltransferase-like [Selaginella moellendorffii]XP_024522757.1 catechol O-methyltransferase-like [Selaginella moellendorffii]|eukprot:XP_024522756.1 catechol O-methyltransferase-like [Selaginella moellendorffii]